jgi:hypothetical protein
MEERTERRSLRFGEEMEARVRNVRRMRRKERFAWPDGRGEDVEARRAVKVFWTSVRRLERILAASGAAEV